jgi:hypothetical protein
MEAVIATLARFGRFYWADGAVRNRDEFHALADADWTAAAIYFIREFAYERQGSSDDYKIAAAEAIMEHAGEHPDVQMTRAVWDTFLRRLHLPATGDGSNKKNQPVAPSYGGGRALLDVIGEFVDDEHNVISWARNVCAAGDPETAHLTLKSIRGISDKIAAFFLRDVISGFELPEDGIPPRCFQPIDVWTRRGSKAIAPGLGLTVPMNALASAAVLVEAAERADVRASDLNAGIWVFAAQFLGSNIGFAEALASEEGLKAALDGAAERVQLDAQRAAQRVAFLAELGGAADAAQLSP